MRSCCNQSQGLFCFLLAVAEHHEVIGVPHKAVAMLLEMPVKHVQSDVGQQRRCDPALGRADARRQELASLHHSGPEKLLNQPQDVPIGHHLGQFPHHGLVAEIVEEAGNIGIEYITIPLPSQLQDLLHRLMAASSWPEAKRMIVKPCLKDRIQQTPKHLLGDPISDCRDSQRAKLGPLGVFGNVDTSSGQGQKRPLFQFPHQPVEVRLQMPFEHLDADLIDSRRTAIPPHGPPSFVHQLGSNPSCQAMNFDLSFCHVLSFC